MTTAAYFLRHLILRLDSTSSPAGPILHTLLLELDTIMGGNGSNVLDYDAAQQTVLQLRVYSQRLLQRSEELQSGMSIHSKHPAALELETGLELVRRLLGKWRDFLEQYQEIFQPTGKRQARRRTEFSPLTDSFIALLNGVRASLAVLLVALFWIATAMALWQLRSHDGCHCLFPVCTCSGLNFCY